ncbi:hypothetical protein GCM10009798_43530 [Nocardioides panacihumi]|uniref:Helix-turn-helix domain-containing protein n=1 Tax=Nocardioides panacihumi TaxID=400774 RepID=A0ABN2RZE9_9ACTN
MTVDPLPVDWLLGHSVAIGPGVMMPERFVARVEIDGAEAEIEIVANILGPRAHKVSVIEVGEDGVNGEALRRIPVASVVKAAARSAVWMRHDLLAGQPGIVSGKTLAEVPDLVRRQWPNGHMTFFLRWVAGVYLVADALGDGPTAAVAKAFNVSRATAGRYVEAARKRKLIPPARGRGTSRPATEEEKAKLRANLGLEPDADVGDYFVVGIEGADEYLAWLDDPFPGWRTSEEDEGNG